MSRLLSLTAVTAACLSLGGCAHQGEAMAWSFHENPSEGVKLAYGQPYSDNVLLMMTCEPGSGRVMLSAISGQDHIELTASNARDRFAAEPGAFGTVEARAHAAAPSLAAFARTGDLALVEGNRRIALAAAPQGDVRRFFGTCRA